MQPFSSFAKSSVSFLTKASLKSDDRYNRFRITAAAFISRNKTKGTWHYLKKKSGQSLLEKTCQSLHRLSGRSFWVCQ